VADGQLTAGVDCPIELRPDGEHFTPTIQRVVLHTVAVQLVARQLVIPWLRLSFVASDTD